MSPPPDRPLRLGELLAETIHMYGERIWASFGLGAVVAGGFLLTFVLPAVVEVIVSSLFFTGAFAAAARIAAGDSFAEAWAQAGLRVPVLAVLAVVVSIPFVLALEQFFLLLLAVAWLGLSGFSIPIAMLERDADDEGWFGRLSHALYRSVALARVEYLHAVGVVAALLILSLLLGILLASALVGFAENGRVLSAALAQAVLAPFFFLGLSVLYFEQRARAAVSSPREKSA